MIRTLRALPCKPPALAMAFVVAMLLASTARDASAQDIGGWVVSVCARSAGVVAFSARM
jgi:hypothetical protein